MNKELQQEQAFRTIALKYPHIGIKIKNLWGQRELHDYMQELYTDTRNGTRRGFPAQDLALLHKIEDRHDYLTGLKPRKEGETIWDFAF